jgi:gamma-glutamyltranspeptidase / glutathione hydrolase
MFPTIVLADGAPLHAVGTPGGATIMTTVVHILVNRLDLGMSLADAVAAPRASQRNTPAFQAEPGLGTHIAALGHEFTDTAEIGAATGSSSRPTTPCCPYRAREARWGQRPEILIEDD